MRLYEAANRTNAETFEGWEIETDAYRHRVEVLTEALRGLPDPSPGREALAGAPIFLILSMGIGKNL